MIHPASDNILSIDLTSCLVMNNVHALGFSAYDLLNICPKINPQAKEIGEITSEANLQQIQQSVQEADIVIVAWGYNWNK